MENFETYLQKSNLANNTIQSYTWTINEYFKKFGKIDKISLIKYKQYLLENNKPKTVNLRLQAINKYLTYKNKADLKVKPLKLQHANFIDNVISDADYKFFCNKLKDENKILWYFVVRFLTATGARVGELIQIKAENIFAGYVDIYSKGGKIGRLFIPKTLKQETLIWISRINLKSGYIFLNKFGKRLTTRGIAQQLKSLAISYGIDEKVVHPHSFRHRFAKNFLEKYNDIALLADIMGHESIETTRIYLRKTATEQQLLIDEIVTW